MNRQYEYGGYGGAYGVQPSGPPAPPQYAQTPQNRAELPDGTSSLFNGAPIFKVRTMTDSVAPDQINDMILAKIRDRINDYFGANIVATYVIGVVGALVYAFAILMAVVKTMAINVPDAIGRMAIWRYLSKWPLTVWLLLAPAAAILVDVAKWHGTGKPLSIYLTAAVAVLILIYVIRSWSVCPRYLLLVIAVYGIAVSIIRMGVLGFQTVAQSGIVTGLVEWFYLLTVVISIIDLFIVVPQCRQLR